MIEEKRVSFYVRKKGSKKKKKVSFLGRRLRNGGDKNNRR